MNLTAASHPGPVSRLPAWATFAAIALALVAATCKKRPADDAATETARQAMIHLPALRLTDDTPDLLITWLDERGDAHPVNKMKDIPTEARGQVRVVVTTREEGTRDLFYVADLSRKNPDGTYPVSTMTRDQWGEVIARRRQAFAGTAPPTEAPKFVTTDDKTPPQVPAANTSHVIVYGAWWCAPCQHAMTYLKQHQVPAVEKDVERDSDAATEMRAALDRAGLHATSIPVIDVRGRILVGFEPHQLQKALDWHQRRRAAARRPVSPSL